MNILNKLLVFLEAGRKNTKQFSDSVPDSKAMRKYAHKRYVDVNKDWIPKKRLKGSNQNKNLPV
jgi:hypothetical protein